MTILEVHVDSKEILKPSSPTPPHLNLHKLTFLEQFIPPYYMPVILFYKITNGEQKLHQLKLSLSKTLTKFPPVAGRIRDNLSIDCNDEGILYVEAQVNTTMEDFLHDIDIKFLERFLPCGKAPTGPITQAFQAAIQVTVFQCGGLVIGGYFSHKIMDAVSVSCFLQSWVQTFKGINHKSLLPDFTSALAFFPPQDYILPPGEDSVTYDTDDTCKIKRFVFSASAIKALKAKAISDLVPHPSRVQVISAFIWKHALAALNKLNKVPQNGKGKTSYFTHTINLRNPNLTPLSLRCMGSLTLGSVASIGWDEKEQDLSGYVAKVHEAILKVNKEHVNKFRGEEALEAMWADAEMLLFGREGIYMCASMCKIGFNDLDFGWGKPIWGSPWAGVPTLAERNFLILVDFNGGEESIHSINSEQ
ncbi:hypothetical protein Droror1_Dr00002624 [Drosera rotundifolia]